MTAARTGSPATTGAQATHPDRTPPKTTAPADDPTRPTRITTLQPHQQQAVNDIRATYATGTDRAVLVLPCGTGKTLVGAEVARLDAPHRIVVFLPSLALIEQTLREWHRLPGLDIDPVVVCSDQSTAAGVAERDAGDPFAKPVTWQQRKVPVTTDPDRLARLLSRGPRHGRHVVFCTYHSAPTLAAAVQYAAVPIRFDLAIADEAHRLAGQPSKAFRHVLDDDAIPAAKRLFMTATPVVAETGGGTGTTRRPERLSMDDRSVFGPVAHRMSFATAIKSGLLVDYQVLVVADRVSTDRNGRGAATELAALAALRTAAAEHNLRRVLTFHGRVTAAERFVGLLRQAGPLDDGRPTWGRVVAADMPAAQRRTVLTELLDADPDQLAVVSNARCLGEGVDLPAIDGIVFANPKESIVDIVQAVGRVLRRADGKTTGTIVIPVALPDDTGDDDSALLASAFGHVWAVLRALRAHDERLGHELDRIARTDSRRGRVDSSRNVDRVSWLLPPNLVPTATLRLVREVADSWERFFGLLQRYVDTTGHAQVPRGYLTDVPARSTLGEWVERQRVAHRRGLLPPERTSRLEQLPGWMWDPRAAAWLDAYAALRTVAETCHTAGEPLNWAELSHRPSPTGRRDTLGTVAAQDRIAYRRGELDPSRAAHLEQVPGWTWHPVPNDDEAMVDLLADYVTWEKTANVPAEHVESGRPLGAWLAGVRARQVTGMLPAALRDEILAVSPSQGAPGAFRWEMRHTQWHLSLTALRQFVHREGHTRVPLAHREQLADLGGFDVHIGRWVVVQRHDRRHGKLADDRAALLEALPGWRWEVEPAERVRVEIGNTPHGTRTGYVKGCRCQDCTSANVEDNRARERRKAAGLGTTDLVDATRARGHIRILIGRGAPQKGMARAAELNPKTIVELADGTLARIHPETERRVLALTLETVHEAALGGTRVPAGPTWALLDDLIARQWPKAWIARELGFGTGTLQIARTDVLAKTANNVAALHARIGDRVPPPRRWRSKLPTLDELEGASTAAGTRSADRDDAVA